MAISAKPEVKFSELIGRSANVMFKDDRRPGDEWISVHFRAPAKPDQTNESERAEAERKAIQMIKELAAKL